MIDFHFIIFYLLEKFNDKTDFFIKRVENISNKKNDRQKQQHQILLSIDRFDKDVQTIELTIIFESNRLRLLQKMHDRFASKHLEINKILKLLKKNYQWSKMIKNMKQFIKNCHICRKTKAARDKYQELLNSLSIFNRF